MINNVTNVDTHTNMSITKAATTLASNPIPPLIGFRGKRADEKATLRVKKIKRNDNIIIVGNIDEDYVEYKPKKVKVEPEISKADIRIIEDIHAMKDAQRKRLMKYMEALKQIEALEDME